MSVSSASHPIRSIVCKGYFFLCATDREVHIASYNPASTPSQETVSINEDIACIASDPFEISSPLTFIAGHSSGKVSLHYFGRYSWFNKSGQVLHQGHQSPVKAVETMQGCVLWSDEFHLTIMLIHPKELMFHMALSTYSLNIALTLAHLILTRSSDPSAKDLMQTVFVGHGSRFTCIVKASGPKKLPEVKYERDFPCLLLQVSNFDASSVTALGYPLVTSADSSSRGINASVLQLMVLECDSGEVVRSQHLCMNGSLNTLTGLFFFSTYNMPSRFLNYTKWRNESLGTQRVR